ncbi:MAG: hypothetical protein EA369_09440 [Bradymonadales bacterium]|nr:MAG: hypothetical protein EA369_09440 [Bradymonadales bacterium]
MGRKRGRRGFFHIEWLLLGSVFVLASLSFLELCHQSQRDAREALRAFEGLRKELIEEAKKS